MKKSIEGIRQKVLTNSLRSMEADGIIIRIVYKDSPLKIEYSLSELGESMSPYNNNDDENQGISYGTE